MGETEAWKGREACQRKCDVVVRPLFKSPAMDTKLDGLHHKWICQIKELLISHKLCFIYRNDLSTLMVGWIRLCSYSMVLCFTSSEIVGQKMEWYGISYYDNLAPMDFAVPSSSFTLFDSCHLIKTQLCRENKMIHNNVKYLDMLD